MNDLSRLFVPVTAPPEDRRNYIEIAPSVILKPYIRCFWGTPFPKNNSCEAEGGNTEPFIVVPDTCMDVIFELDYRSNTFRNVFCGINDTSFFNNEKLGISIQFEGYGNSDGARLGFGKQEPGIIIWDENKWGSLNSGTVSFAFFCDSLDATYRELKAKGVELDPPFTAVWGGREINVKDPDGNNIILLEQE